MIYQQVVIHAAIIPYCLRLSLIYTLRTTPSGLSFGGQKTTNNCSASWFRCRFVGYDAHYLKREVYSSKEVSNPFATVTFHIGDHTYGSSMWYF
jgi:hypothetical protein